jgi:hypothetical protein
MPIRRSAEWLGSKPSIIAAERMAQDLFYVSATRAREGLTVITSDSLTLQESIGISGDRQSASELARRTVSVDRGKGEDFRLYEAQSEGKQQLRQQQGLQEERNAHTHSAIIRL